MGTGENRVLFRNKRKKCIKLFCRLKGIKLIVVPIFLPENHLFHVFLCWQIDVFFFHLWGNFYNLVLKKNFI